VLPGIIDAQSATFDDTDADRGRAHIQMAERITRMAHAQELLSFDNFAPQQ
jgi:hypothetical protein